jgi:prepilin-type N-terminal cleavage/methylation domain-containing protein
VIFLGGAPRESSAPARGKGPEGARRIDQQVTHRLERCQREEGFTLLEVLVALTILGLSVVTLIQLSSQSLRLVKTSGDYQDAVLVADRLASETQATDEVIDNGQEGPYRWERRIILVQLPDELKSKQIVPGQEDPKLFAVTIDVHWGQNRMIELATLRTPTSVPAPPTQGTPAAGVQPTTSLTPGKSTTPATPQTGGSSPMGGLGSR